MQMQMPLNKTLSKEDVPGMKRMRSGGGYLYNLGESALTCKDKFFPTIEVRASGE